VSLSANDTSVCRSKSVDQSEVIFHLADHSYLLLSFPLRLCTKLSKLAILRYQDFISSLGCVCVFLIRAYPQPQYGDILIRLKILL
jgi:hypothetical protein